MCEIDSSWGHWSLAVSFWDLRLNPPPDSQRRESKDKAFSLGTEGEGRGRGRGRWVHWQQLRIGADLGDDFISNGRLSSNGCPRHRKKQPQFYSFFILGWCVMFVKLFFQKHKDVGQPYKVYFTPLSSYHEFCCEYSLSQEDDSIRRWFFFSPFGFFSPRSESPLNKRWGPWQVAVAHKISIKCTLGIYHLHRVNKSFHELSFGKNRTMCSRTVFAFDFLSC